MEAVVIKDFGLQAYHQIEVWQDKKLCLMSNQAHFRFFHLWCKSRLLPMFSEPFPEAKTFYYADTKSILHHVIMWYKFGGFSLN